MKLRELNRVLALSLAVSLVTPMTAFASEPANVVAEVPDGCYYDEDGVLRNADGSVYVDESGNIVTKPVDTEVVSEVQETTESPDVVANDTASTTETVPEVTVDGSDTGNNNADGSETAGGSADEESADSSDKDDTSSGDNTSEDNSNDSTADGGESDKDDATGGADTDEDKDSSDKDGDSSDKNDGSEDKDDDTENKDDTSDKDDSSDSSDTEKEPGKDTEKEPGKDVIGEGDKGVVDEDPVEAEPDVTENESGVVVDEDETPVASGTGSRGRIQMPVTKIKDFRFYTIEKEYAFAKEDLDILEEQKDDARVMGTLQKDGRCFVIKDVDEEWTFVESENVRGFVRNEKLYLNEEADKIVEDLKAEAQRQTDEENNKIKEDLLEKLKKEYPDLYKNRDSSKSVVGAVAEKELKKNLDEAKVVAEEQELGKSATSSDASSEELGKSSNNGIVSGNTSGVVADDSQVESESTSGSKGVVQESGIVGGDEVTDSEAEDENLSEFDKKFNEEFEKVKKPLIDFETLTETAKELISWKENKNLAYSRGTIKNFVTEKDYALVTASLLNVREGKGTDTRIVAQLPENALVYQLADKEEEWIFVESGDVRGFVYNEWVKDGEEVDQEVAETGEDNFPKVNEIINYEEVESKYYVRESVKEGKYSSKAREQIVEYASQFIGNPYVWGGTDPVNGADCSGFVQTIYGDFGYSLPRVAADQAYYGTKIAVEDALPGDLIFYMDSTGYIYHVVMYAGDGRTVEAMGSKYGITTGTVSSNVCWATRIISEDDDVTQSGDVVVRYADSDEYGQYLGNYKLTYYCACSICCGDYANGITATGTIATEGRTIAVDPRVIPYGSEVIINGRVYVAEDCGGAIKGNRIDVYMNSHEECLRQGITSAEVYLKK